jgi:hypothetical protein
MNSTPEQDVQSDGLNTMLQSIVVLLRQAIYLSPLLSVCAPCTPLDLEWLFLCVSVAADWPAGWHITCSTEPWPLLVWETMPAACTLTVAIPSPSLQQGFLPVLMLWYILSAWTE